MYISNTINISIFFVCFQILASVNIVKILHSVRVHVLLSPFVETKGDIKKWLSAQQLHRAPNTKLEPYYSNSSCMKRLYMQTSRLCALVLPEMHSFIYFIFCTSIRGKFRLRSLLCSTRTLLYLSKYMDTWLFEQACVSRVYMSARTGDVHVSDLFYIVGTQCVR